MPGQAENGQIKSFGSCQTAKADLGRYFFADA